MEITQMEVARSCSKTLQVTQFNPITFFSSYKAVVEGNPTIEELRELGETLYDRAEEDVLGKEALWKNPASAGRKEMTKRQLINAIEKYRQEVADLKIQVAKLDQPF